MEFTTFDFQQAFEFTDTEDPSTVSTVSLFPIIVRKMIFSMISLYGSPPQLNLLTIEYITLEFSHPFHVYNGTYYNNLSFYFISSKYQD